VTSPPFSDRPSLSAEGRRLLEEQLRDRERALAELEAALQDPERPTETVESYQRAEQELDRLRSILASAQAIEDRPDDPSTVELGDRVTIRLQDGGEESYVIAHPAEAAMADERISVDSPLGRALFGRRVGEAVEVAAPEKPYTCTIVTATRAASSPDHDG
jgi:transcription elongation GreA/GreB family factor